MRTLSPLRFVLCFTLALAGIFSGPAQSWQPSAELTLTRDEAAWRRSHPTIRVGIYAGDHMPFESWRGGQPDGMAVDYVRILAGHAGMQVEFHPYTDWGAVSFGAGNAAEFDLLLTQPVKPDRMGRFLLLRPYAYTSPALIARNEPESRDFRTHLQSARLVVERRFALQAREIHAELPGASIEFADDAREAMDMVSAGRADAYVAPNLGRAQLVMSQRGAEGLILLDDVPLPSYGIAPAVRRDLPELAQILRKSEATITSTQLVELRSRWGAEEIHRRASAIETPATRSGYEPSPTRSTLAVGYEVDRYPYSFTNNEGKFDGIAADYLKLLQRRLDLSLKFVPASDWADLQRKVSAGQVDVIVAGTSNDFDPSLMRFSQPYEYFPEVLVTRERGPTFVSPADLANRVVAVRAESGVVERVLAKFERSRIIPVPSNEAGLRLVDDGEAAAFIGTLPAIDALIRSRYAGRLRIVGPAGMDQELAFGIRAGKESLLPLIDHVLETTEERDRQSIRNRWIATRYEYGVAWRWVAIVASFIGLVLGIFAFAYIRLRRAIAARTVAEKDLADQLAFQHALLESIPYPVFVRDGAARYTAVNRAYETFFDIPRAAVIGRTTDEISDSCGEELQTLHASEQEIIISGDSFRRELTLSTTVKPGVRSMLLWMHAFRDRNSSTVSVLGTLVDVTEIKQAEARARSSEQRLSDISAALPGTVFQLQQGEERSRKFTYLAGDVQGLLGGAADGFIQNIDLLLDRLHPDDRDSLHEVLDLSAIELAPWGPLDVRLATGGSWKWLRSEGGRPRRSSDDTVEWSGYLVDVSVAHDQAEALSEAKALAESAASAKSAFLATMSHEIRTPMAGVLGLVELLGRTSLDRDQRQMLDMATDSAQAMLQILDDILDYSRIESGRLCINLAAFDPRKLLDSVAGLFSARVREKSLKIHAVYDWRVARGLVGDAVRIRQILTNLMSNAVKFTEKGSITLAMSLDGHRDGDQLLRFTVEDSGIGIDPENLKLLFQPFAQAEQSTTRRFGGTGLGLTISRRLADLMGGALTLESMPGEGSKATLEIALQPATLPGTTKGFDGCGVWLACENPLRNTELSNALSALGFLVKPGLNAPGAEDLKSVSLIVADVALMRSWLRPLPDVPMIQVDESLSGSQIVTGPEGVRLSCNPVLWHVVCEACEIALDRRRVEIVPLQSPAPTIRNGIILVAEDHPTNQAVIGRQLDAMGYSYVQVENGEQALDAMSAIDFDLLITDCHMPNLDGFALARRVRGREPEGRHLPIVALSASALPEQVQRCLEAGMDDFLAKPVQFAQLKEKLDHYLPQHLATGVAAPLADTQDAAAADEPSVLQASQNPIVQLSQEFGSQEVALRLVSQLIQTTHEDLEKLEALAYSAGQARRDLLHRIEGALRIVRIPQMESAMPLALQDSSAREAQVRTNLRQLEEFLAKYEA